MKRLTVLWMILACIAVLCPAQRRGRTIIQKIIQLNEPSLSGSVSFEEALVRQRDVSRIARRSLERTHLAQLAWAGLGISRQQANLQTATTSSVEQTSPIQLYFATSEGLFVYQPIEHSLLQTQDQDLRIALAEATSAPAPVAGAGCNIIIVGSPRQLTAQFGNKAGDILLTETGRIVQNIQLQAVCMDLPYVAVVDFNARNISRICGLTRDMEVLYIISIGYMSGQVAPITGLDQPQTAPKRAALITPALNFQDEELFETIAALESAAIQPVIASTRRGIIRGVLGNTAEASILVSQIQLNEFHAIILIGGSGAADFAGDLYVLNLIREAVRSKKIVGATSIAPTILANAGVITGLRVTGFISESDRLTQAGGIYTGLPVEQDQGIITASGPVAAVQFGRTIADAIIGQ